MDWALSISFALMNRTDGLGCVGYEITGSFLLSKRVFGYIVGGEAFVIGRRDGLLVTAVL